MANILSYTEISRLLSSTTTARDRLLLQTAYETAATTRELATLKTANIHAHTISIGGRECTASAELCTELKAYASTHEYVFYSRQSPHISQKRAEQLLKKLLPKGTTPQILRYSWIAHNAEKTLEEIQAHTGLKAQRAAVLKQLYSKTAEQEPPIPAHDIEREDLTRDQLLVAFLRATGLTSKEVTHITKQQLTNSRLHIQSRTIILPAKLAAALHTHAHTHTSSFLFCSRQRGQLTQKRVEQIVSKSTGQNPQQLRYTHIREALSAGVSVDNIAAYIGISPERVAHIGAGVQS